MGTHTRPAWARTAASTIAALSLTLLAGCSSAEVSGDGPTTTPAIDAPSSPSEGGASSAPDSSTTEPAQVSSTGNETSGSSSLIPGSIANRNGSNPELVPVATDAIFTIGHMSSYTARWSMATNQGSKENWETGNVVRNVLYAVTLKNGAITSATADGKPLGPDDAQPLNTADMMFLAQNTKWVDRLPDGRVKGVILHAPQIPASLAPCAREGQFKLVHGTMIYNTHTQAIEEIDYKIVAPNFNSNGGKREGSEGKFMCRFGWTFTQMKQDTP